MASILHFVFGIFGNVIALSLFMSPIITFSRIIKNKSTEQFSGVPYVSALMNCLLSAWYGLPFVSPHNLLVSTIDGTGIAIELIYVLLFLFYAPKKIKTKIFTLFMVVLVGCATIALVSLFALHGHIRKLFCGLAAAIFSICISRKQPRTEEVEIQKAPKCAKRPKDPNRPKKPQPAFFVFMEEFRKKYKEDNADAKGVNRQGADKWNSMTEEYKKPCFTKAHALKMEYGIDMAKYLEEIRQANEEADSAEVGKIDMAAEFSYEDYLYELEDSSYYTSDDSSE